jgi:hypothetical protein
VEKKKEAKAKREQEAITKNQRISSTREKVW